MSIRHSRSHAPHWITKTCCLLRQNIITQSFIYTSIMRVTIRSHVHVYSPTYTHTATRIFTHMQPHNNTCTHTVARNCIYTHEYDPTLILHTFNNARTHTYTDITTHSCLHTYSPLHTHTYTRPTARWYLHTPNHTQPYIHAYNHTLVLPRTYTH